ncbi:MAG: hypothetical protein RR361_08480 [Anaerovorax sp.]
MEIKIILKGSMRRFFDGEGERMAEVPDGCSCHEALKSVGIDYQQIPRFGFVAVNSSRVMISDALKEGDQLKVYPKISGG